MEEEEPSYTDWKEVSSLTDEEREKRFAQIMTYIYESIPLEEFKEQLTKLMLSIDELEERGKPFAEEMNHGYPTPTTKRRKERSFEWVEDMVEAERKKRDAMWAGYHDLMYSDRTLKQIEDSRKKAVWTTEYI